MTEEINGMAEQAITDLEADGLIEVLEAEAEQRASKAQFLPFSLKELLDDKVLWAANYYILWPLGLALTVEIVDHEVTNLHVREWVYPEGELGETINLTKEENQSAYVTFLAFVRARLLAMKPEERHVLLHKYEDSGITTPKQLLVVDP